MAELVVDGPRPAVAWVSSLPAGLVSSIERLVLYVLAADAFDDVSMPGGANLMQWTDLRHGTVYEVLGRLCEPTSSRPALIERLGQDGKPLGNRKSGRVRTRYRLCVEVAPQPSSDPGQLANRPVSRDGYESEQSANRPVSRDGYESQPSRQPSRQPSSEPGHTLPYPSRESPYVTNRSAAARNGAACTICSLPEKACRRASAIAPDPHEYSPRGGTTEPAAGELFPGSAICADCGESFDKPGLKRSCKPRHNPARVTK